MPIVGRKPKDCFDQFRDHMAKLVADTLTDRDPLTLNHAGPERVWLTFKTPHQDAAALATNVGTVYFYVSQQLIAQKQKDKSFMLETHSYAYKIYAEKPTLTGDARLRWEYEKHPRNEHCRHHFQVGRLDSKAVVLPVADGEFDLNRLHLPTGWVLLEYVIRFLIDELGVKPRCGDSWPEVLKASEEAFFGDFSSKVARSPSLPND